MAKRMPSKLSGEIGAIPLLRLSLLNDRPPKAEGEFVVYWMTAARRTRWNFALQRAVGWARELKRPLVIIEVLACGGRWDSDRHHRFVLQGMAGNARHLETPQPCTIPTSSRSRASAVGSLRQSAVRLAWS